MQFVSSCQAHAGSLQKITFDCSHSRNNGHVLECGGAPPLWSTREFPCAFAYDADLKAAEHRRTYRWSGVIQQSGQSEPTSRVQLRPDCE